MALSDRLMMVWPDVIVVVLPSGEHEAGMVQRRGQCLAFVRRAVAEACPA